MTQNEYINKLLEYNQEELYFKKIYEENNYTYNDTAYRRFGHYFVENVDLLHIGMNESMELINKMYSRSLGENSIRVISGSEDANLVFSKHPRYTPSRFHGHEFFEIVYQLRGNSMQNINGTDLIMKPGDVCFIPPNTFHTIIAPGGDNLAINICLKSSNFEDCYNDFLKTDNNISSFFLDSLYNQNSINYMLIETGSYPRLDNLVIDSMMLSERAKIDSYARLYQMSAVNQLFSILAMDHLDFCSLSRRTNKSIDIVLKIVVYIKNNFHEVTLNDLSRTFHYTVPYISRMIKEETGHTFSELVQSIKINKSCTMLENTNLTVAEISALVGYKAPENYMRIFKRALGLTPSEYRAKIKKSI